MSALKRRAILANLLLVAGSCLFALFAVEIGLRIAGYNHPVMYRYDRHTGFTRRANVAMWVGGESMEFVRLDEHGLRTYDRPGAGPALGKDKPPGTLRIAVLGDSFTESHHVAFEESFPYLIGRRLGACSSIGMPVEVLNFAVSGYGSVQELQTFRHKTKDFDPDVVLLVFHANNDLRNNHAVLERNPFIPYARFEDGELVLDLSFQDDPNFQWKLKWANLRNTISNRFRMLQFVTNVAGHWRQMRWHEGRVDAWKRMERQGTGNDEAAPAASVPEATAEATEGRRPLTRDESLAVESGEAPPSAGRPARAARMPDESGPDLDAYFAADYEPPGLYATPEYFPPRNGFEEALWKLAEALVLRLRDEVEASGGDLWLTSTATGIAIDSAPEARERFRTKHGLETVDYAGHRLATFAERHGIPFVALAEPLRAVAVREGVNFHYHEKGDYTGGHWNSRGHAVVADTIADRLCRRLAAGSGAAATDGG